MTHERCLQFNRFMIEVMGTHSLSLSLSKRKKDFSGLFVSRVHLAPGEVHVRCGPVGPNDKRFTAFVQNLSSVQIKTKEEDAKPFRFSIKSRCVFSYMRWGGLLLWTFPMPPYINIYTRRNASSSLPVQITPWANPTLKNCLPC